MKVDPTGGLFEANTPDFDPNNYYLFSTLAHAGTKWPTFDVITSVPVEDPRYWEDSGTAIVLADGVTIQQIDDDLQGVIEIFLLDRCLRIRLQLRVIFALAIIEYMFNTLDYDKEQMLGVFVDAKNVTREINELDLEQAINKIQSLGTGGNTDVTVGLKIRMEEIIQAVIDEENQESSST